MPQTENVEAVRKRKSFSQAKKQLLTIDMTPMVDLGFLLDHLFCFYDNDL